MKGYIILILSGMLCILFFFFHVVLYKNLLYRLKFNKINKPWIPLLRDNYELHSYQYIVPNKYKICFVTMETRKNLEYVKIHNENLKKYVKYKGPNYTYIFTSDCKTDPKHIHNPYWCKFFVMYDAIKSGKYDYVFWLDSDTIINNPEFDLDVYLTKHNRYSIIGTVDKPVHDMTNAGVFGIKNTKIGNEFLKEGIDYYNSEFFKKKCIRKNNSLRGMWAGICYEQGWMNNAMISKYKPYVFVIPMSIVYNGGSCDNIKDEYIIHIYGSSEKHRKTCFQKLMPEFP